MLKSVTHGYAMGSKNQPGGKFQFGKRRIGQLFQFSMDGAVCCFSR